MASATNQGRGSLLDFKSRIVGARKSSLVRNTGWMIFGQGWNFFLQAGYFILLARLLGVVEYGIFAGAFALVNTVTPYSSLGSPILFMRYVSADRNAAPSYWGNILVTITGSTLILTVLLSLVGGRMLGHGSVLLIMILALSNCFMGQIVNSAGVIFQTFETLKDTAWLQMLSNLFRLVAILILLIIFRHATALACSMSILGSSTLAAACAVIWVTHRIPRIEFNRKLLRHRFLEGLGFSFAGSTQAIYNDVDKMMLSHYGMNAADGFYTMAYRVVDFSTAPVSAIDAALLPRYFSLNAGGIHAIARTARRAIPIGILAGVVAAICTLGVSPLLVRVVGHGFDDALIVIRWLCCLPILRAIHQLAGGILTATGHQGYRTGAQCLAAVLNILLNIFWIPKFGWHGAAWASLISDGSLGGLNLVIVLLLFRSMKLDVFANNSDSSQEVS